MANFAIFSRMAAIGRGVGGKPKQVGYCIRFKLGKSHAADSVTALVSDVPLCDSMPSIVVQHYLVYMTLERFNIKQ